MTQLSETHRRKPLSPEELKKIDTQMAQRDVIRRDRATDSLREARKKAMQLFALLTRTHYDPHLPLPFATSVNNSGEIMVKALVRRVEQEQPIAFVGFWGVGDKNSIDSKDRELIDEYQRMVNAVQKEYPPGAHVSIILADMHGRFNGYARGVQEHQLSQGQETEMPQPNQYLSQIQEELNRTGISSVWLSSLYQQFCLSLPDVHAPIDFESEAHIVFARHRDQYTRSAALRSRSDMSPEKAAEYYVQIRLREREMLLQAFPDTILVVNGNRMTSEPLMPKNMPTLYLQEGPAWFQKGESVIQ